MPNEIIIEQKDIVHLEDDPSIEELKPGVRYYDQSQILREILNLYQYLNPANKILVRLALSQTEIKDIE